ncbi:hypothetical protein [Pseudomonas nitroreducens]|uniref:hypothetical protein n=1 Tax=Pseudomonas nitroreducens TaxID=46680 RepID=UPI0026585248|nr:hypothetical protein [Pseudomonas nitroreducens]MCP1652318.1 hypothetical protein [Pseudomonas nitroreducens]MCP1689828.1 hypothetical protein [Pseudomonas nitroreducens]
MSDLRHPRPRLEKHVKARRLDNLKASTLDGRQDDVTGLTLDLEITSNVEGPRHHLHNGIVEWPIGRKPE